jgi:hypothetical protein
VSVPMRPALLVCGPGSKGVRGGPTSRKDRDNTLLAALREVRWGQRGGACGETSAAGYECKE